MPFFHRSILRVLMIFFLLGAIGLALPAEKVRSQGTATTLQIVKVDASAFPEIRVQFFLISIK